MGKLIKKDLCSWSTASMKALFRFIQYSASVIGFGSRGAAASNPAGIQNLLVIRYSSPSPPRRRCRQSSSVAAAWSGAFSVGEAFCDSVSATPIADHIVYPRYFDNSALRYHMRLRTLKSG